MTIFILYFAKRNLETSLILFDSFLFILFTIAVLRIILIFWLSVAILCVQAKQTIQKMFDDNFVKVKRTLPHSFFEESFE